MRDVEILLSVDVYVSNKAATALKKPAPPRKKAEKRDSRALSIMTDENQKKVKEKTSWLSISRATTAGDHWRKATCRLAEEVEGCIFNVYIEGTILFQSIYVHLLNHTDIRQADRSLFLRDNCLGIHCSSQQRWSATLTTEPVYLAFSSLDARNITMALLRSYAVPEVYGPSNTTEGGMYRMWRQVEVGCIQGRGFGSPRTSSESSTVTGVSLDEPDNYEGDAVDLDLFCEIYYNNTLSGRTVVKKSVGSPDWHEHFTFGDLPPFARLTVVLWREKKLTKPSVLGTVYITLANFRRGEYVEGWFPVLYGASSSSSIQVGQIRLKIKVDEEIVLPSSAYNKMLSALDTRNYLDWMNEFEVKLKIKHLSYPLVAIAVASNTLLDQVFELADREVDGSSRSHNTLFRGNTALTKTAELLMGCYGRPFLEASVGSTIRRLCADNVAIEVDPARSGNRLKDIERNVELLIYWCQEFWDQIYAVRMECPEEMRQLFKCIRELVEKRYGRQDAQLDDAKDLPSQSVSAFCFLRFIVPAILHPHLFGLCPGLPDLPVQRSLTLIAKVIQSLANLNATTHKEEFMRGVKSFLDKNHLAMSDYILIVSKTDIHTSAQPPDEVALKRRMLKVLHERKQSMPILQREAIPHLPYFLDIPRQLGVIATTLLRHIRRPPSLSETPLDKLTHHCFDIEQQALYRVSNLAALNDSISASSYTSSIHSHTRTDVIRPSISDISTPPSSSRPRNRLANRPQTAPNLPEPSRSKETLSETSSQSRSNHARGFSNPHDSSTSLTYTSLGQASHEGGSWPHRKHIPTSSHVRSASTDSVTARNPSSTCGSQHGSSPASPVDAQLAGADEMGKKRGFLRTILVRK
ncbi:Rho GTPase activation protein [Amylostereum chailletii]|nr:Rho GTPase activation protein [Amylostereum chailletii]